MKLIPILLINLLSVGAGIFVYDQVREDDAGDVHYTEHTTTIADSGDAPAPMLSGSSASAARVDALEKELASLREAFARRHGREAGNAVASTDGDLTAPIDLKPVEGADPETGEGGIYDEKTLDTLKSYMEEIRRQDRQERAERGVMRQLERLDIDLTEAQQKAVVDATLTMQRKRGEMFRNVPRGDMSTEEGRQKFREEMQKAGDVLREEYSTTVYSLVPAAEAEKIVEGMSTSRNRSTAMGFGGNRGGRRGR